MKKKELRKALENLHNVKAKHLRTEHVSEQFKGDLVWSGDVEVFEIEGHSNASLCYAWSSPIEGSEKRRVYAVLRIPPVESATDAVRASIVQEHKK